MTSAGGVHCRLAGPGDAGAVTRFDPAFSPGSRERCLPDPSGLASAMESGELLCFMAERDGAPEALLFMLHDAAQGLCKLHRIYVPAEAGNAGEISKALILAALEILRRSPAMPDIVYATTRTLTPEQQQITLDAGFRMLGVFPNAYGADRSGVNGLTAYFFDGVLEKKRRGRFPLHPALAPFYEIAAAECGLETMEAAAPPPCDWRRDSRLPALEPIRAARFVEGRFGLLKSRTSLAASFYPFQKPNLLITNPEQTIEIFCRAADNIRFAAVIGERIAEPVDPVRLYLEISGILETSGSSYVEMINDAADISGVDCLLRAGYTPCAYFPCLKKHAGLRRDYVIFSKSFGRDIALSSAGLAVPYARFLEAYLSFRAKTQPPI